MPGQQCSQEMLPCRHSSCCFWGCPVGALNHRMKSRGQGDEEAEESVDLKCFALSPPFTTSAAENLIPPSDHLPKFSGSLSGRAEHIRPLAAWEETQETLLLSHFLSGSWKCVPLTHTLLTCPGFTASAKGQLCSLGLHWMYFALTLAGACGWWCLFRFLL